MSLSFFYVFHFLYLAISRDLVQRAQMSRKFCLLQYIASGLVIKHTLISHYHYLWKAWTSDGNIPSKIKPLILCKTGGFWLMSSQGLAGYKVSFGWYETMTYCNLKDILCLNSYVFGGGSF